MSKVSMWVKRLLKRPTKSTPSAGSGVVGAKKVSMWVKLALKPGTRDDAAAAIQVAIDNVQDEAGTEIYILHADPNNADVLYFYELYSSGEALGAHAGAPWFKAFGPTLAPFLAGAPEMVMLSPLKGKGL